MFTQLVVISYITRRISGYVSRIKSSIIVARHRDMSGWHKWIGRRRKY